MIYCVIYCYVRTNCTYLTSRIIMLYLDYHWSVLCIYCLNRNNLATPPPHPTAAFDQLSVCYC